MASAGHVDHGKSTVVRALTGHEPDRLAEERRRGLTIDLGFGWTQLDRSGWTAFVDVPGHVDFIRNMIAGVAVVDAALLVVDAREGWRTQTHEHLFILRTVGIAHVVAAVTKADTADDGRLAATMEQTRENLRTVGLDQAPVIACDAISGAGVHQLRGALDAMLAGLAPPRDRGRARLWVDRSFSIRGTGTVVTGGVTDGSLGVGDRVSIVGDAGPVDARIRAIEALGEARDGARPGGRAAINLARVDHRTIRRGDALVRPGEWHLTDTIDVELRVAPTLTHGVTRRGAFTAHIGTSSMAVPVRLIGGTEIAPGERGLARLHLPRRLPLVPGDRYVLVESGRSETIGGGEVLDVAPVVPVMRARPDRSIDRVVTERGWVAVDELELLTGVRCPPVIGRWVVHEDELRRQRGSLLDAVAASGSNGIPMDSLEERQLAVIEQLGTEQEVQLRGGVAVAPAQRDALDDHPFLRHLLDSPFQPPTAADEGVDQPTLIELRRRGLITSLDGLHFATSAIDQAADVFARLIGQHPEGVTIAQFRDALGTTRKWAMPILAHLDAGGISRRVDEVRVAGPRMRPASLKSV
ncbi:MAG: selenocysteine-specific translation elongation factor [Acidimicrobiia bacterium]|nr:selenocysteine-specific translation elongation factor [Acidimicrobiia bacterium]